MNLHLLNRFFNNQFLAIMEQFIKFGMSMPHFNPNTLEICCPCSRCKNKKLCNLDEVSQHLQSYGFFDNYYEWVYQREIDAIFGAFLNESRQHEECSSSLFGRNTVHDMFDNVAINPIRFGNMEQMVHDNLGCHPNAF